MAQADDASAGTEAVGFAAPGEVASGEAGHPKEKSQQVADWVIPEVTPDFGIAYHAPADHQRLHPAVDDAPGEQGQGKRPVSPVTGMSVGSPKES